MSFGLAIVGATGNVGRKIIEVLEKRNFPVKELYLIASENSVGNKIIFKVKFPDLCAICILPVTSIDLGCKSCQLTFFFDLYIVYCRL